MSVIYNNKLTRRKVYNRCFSVLICVLLMASSIQGTILCNAGDAHITIEAINSNCCDNLPVSDSREASVASAELRLSLNRSNCVPCMDVLISVDLAKIFKKPNQVDPISLVSTTIIPVAINGCDFYKYQLGSEPLAIVNPSLSSLRSIILLI